MEAIDDCLDDLYVPAPDALWVPLDIELLDPAKLRVLTDTMVATVYHVAKNSGNLKGGYIRDLKVAARTLKEIIDTALTRTVAEETLCLRRELRKARQGVEELKAESDQMKEERDQLKRKTDARVEIPSL